MKKLVLAYSGGLDTSYCAMYLAKKEKFEVHAVSINTGGFTIEDLKDLEFKAEKLGVTTYKNIDAIDKYYDKVIKYLIFGNVLKNNTYPLSVSAERIIQALEIIEYAKSIDAKFIAHGSTGAGNDQVRFDLIFQILAPEVTIITPIRDNALSRQNEIDFLHEYNIHIPWEKAKYSINKGLWGTSIGGDETLTSNIPLPEEAYPSQLKSTREISLILNFKKGELTAINDDFDTSENLIVKLNTIGSEYAIGRNMHIGDTILGIKGRIGFEAAAATIIIQAHHLLEKHTLTKWQLQHKDYIAKWYGTHLHEGMYLEPVMRDIEAMLTNSQEKVSGKVFVTLKPYHFLLDGITSPHDLLQSDFGSYGEVNKEWDANDAKGFIKIYGNQSKIYQNINGHD